MEQMFGKPSLLEIPMKRVSFADAGLANQVELSSCLPGPLRLYAVLKKYRFWKNLPSNGHHICSNEPDRLGQS